MLAEANKFLENNKIINIIFNSDYIQTYLLKSSFIIYSFIYFILLFTLLFTLSFIIYSIVYIIKGFFIKPWNDNMDELRMWCCSQRKQSLNQCQWKVVCNKLVLPFEKYWAEHKTPITRNKTPITRNKATITRNKTPYGA